MLVFKSAWQLDARAAQGRTSAATATAARTQAQPRSRARRACSLNILIFVGVRSSWKGSSRDRPREPPLTQPHTPGDGGLAQAVDPARRMPPQTLAVDLVAGRATARHERGVAAIQKKTL